MNYGQVHEMIHRDIAVGNDYRKERIKLLATLATGVFALTVTFHKDLFGGTLIHVTSSTPGAADFFKPEKLARKASTPM
jgi:hypothetical protein